MYNDRCMDVFLMERHENDHALCMLQKLICAITTASEVVDLVAEGSSETSSKEMVQKKCQEFLESIEECNATYSRACDSQAGLLIPYAVVGTQNMTWSSSDQAL